MTTMGQAKVATSKRTSAALIGRFANIITNFAFVRAVWACGGVPPVFLSHKDVCRFWPRSLGVRDFLTPFRKGCPPPEDAPILVSA
jgi:hypothetical protein